MKNNPKSRILNNSLNTDKFKLVFNEIKNAEILCQNANIPGLSANQLEIPNSLNKTLTPGNKLTFEPLNISFSIDENLESFKELYNWMIAIYNPIKTEDFTKFQNERNFSKNITPYRKSFDASLFTLKNSNLPNIELKFKNMFPTSLTGLDLTITTDEKIIGSATFEYDYYTF